MIAGGHSPQVSFIGQGSHRCTGLRFSSVSYARFCIVRVGFRDASVHVKLFYTVFIKL